MRRHLPFLLLLALVAAACGGTTESSSTTVGDPTTSTPVETTSTAAAVEAVLLSYTLSAGDQIQYEVNLDQHIELSTTGDSTLMGDEEMPGEAAVDLSGTATFTHTVSDGPDPGTYEVHIVGEFDDVTVTGTVDGESFDSADTPDFAAIDPVDVTVVVDEQGRPVTEAGEAPLEGLLGGLGAMGSGGAPASGLDIGQFVGPQLPDEEVGVGDTWTDEIETPGLGEEPIVTSVSSTVTGVDQVDGVDVFVIESTSSTSPIEFDLAEFFAGMLGAFAPEGATAEEQAEVEAMLEQLRFLFTVDGATADTTTLFDVEAGVSRQSQTASSANISMDMNVPDEATGEMMAFVMDMTLDQDVSYRLLSGTGA